MTASRQPLIADAQEQERRRSFVVRIVLRQVALVQDRTALLAAGRVGVALPFVQAALLVGVLKAEPWQALLACEGLVIAWLALSQFRRATIEGKLTGYGVSLLNALAMGAAGVTLGCHLLWITGALGMAVLTRLVFAPTRTRTVRNAWIAFALLLLPLALFCGAARLALETSSSEADPAARGTALSLAWVGFRVRGGSGTERALLRLRQAQAAFEAGDYRAAYRLADNGAFDDRGRSRVPATPIGADLLDSLLRVKAQALYNQTWGKTARIYTNIGLEPLPAEELAADAVRVRWAW